MAYSDDDLAEAVRSSRSWRGVLRHLAVPSKSSGSMRSARRRAQTLALDCSHFTGQRRYSDSELADAIAAARTWSAVVTRLGLTDGGRNLAAVRGRAERLQLEVAHLEPAPPRFDASFADTPRPELLRTAAPALAAAWFQLRGYAVSWPLEPCRYDLLVERAGSYSRIQVKTTVARASTRGVVSLSTSRRNGCQTYAHDEIDYLFVVDADLDAYLIPVAQVAGRYSITVGHYRAFLIAERGQWLVAPLSACASPAP